MLQQQLETEFDASKALPYKPDRTTRTALVVKKSSDEVTLVETEVGRQRLVGPYVTVMKPKGNTVWFACKLDDWYAMCLKWRCVDNSWHADQKALAYLDEDGSWLLQVGNEIIRLDTQVFEIIYDINSAPIVMH